MGRHKSSSIWAVRTSASLLRFWYSGPLLKRCREEDWATIVMHPKAHPTMPLCSPPQSWFSLPNDDHLMGGFYRNSENIMISPLDLWANSFFYSWLSGVLTREITEMEDIDYEATLRMLPLAHTVLFMSTVFSQHRAQQGGSQIECPSKSILRPGVCLENQNLGEKKVSFHTANQGWCSINTDHYQAIEGGWLLSAHLVIKTLNLLL